MWGPQSGVDVWPLCCSLQRWRDKNADKSPSLSSVLCLDVCRPFPFSCPTPFVHHVYFSLLFDFILPATSRPNLPSLSYPEAHKPVGVEEKLRRPFFSASLSSPSPRSNPTRRRPIKHDSWVGHTICLQSANWSERAKMNVLFLCFLLGVRLALRSCIFFLKEIHRLTFSLLTPVLIPQLRISANAEYWSNTSSFFLPTLKSLYLTAWN